MQKPHDVLENDAKTGFIKCLDIGEQFDQNFEDFKPVPKQKKALKTTKNVELSKSEWIYL